MYALTLTIPLVFAQTDALPPFPLPDVPPKLPTYAEACSLSLKTGKPLVVFVGIEACPITGKIVCSAESLPGYVKGDVVECSSDGTAVYFERYVQRGVRPIAAVPFGRTAQPEPRLDDGRLPSVLKKMTRYERAKYTQMLFGLEFHSNQRIRPVLRETIEQKWQVPGGMVDINGWRSDLYEYLPSPPKSWQGDSRVPQGFGWMPGFRQSYADGSIFADVLSCNGSVFEVRIAEKQGVNWDRFVAFKDVSARPVGYHGLMSKQCTECHSQTASGKYNNGNVPGDDSVISKGLPRVEEGVEVRVN